MSKRHENTVARGLCLGLLLGSLFSAPAFAQDAKKPEPKLPNGATSLSETYDDWVLNCQATDKGPGCVLSQVLSQQDGQRVLTISISPVEANGTYAASLILPFGLELAAGVSLALDDKPSEGVLPFKTCLPAGCIVPVTWPVSQYEALGGGTTLKINAQSAANEPFSLSVSLKGLSAAGKRAQEIIK